MKTKFALYLLFILIFLSGCTKRTQEGNITVTIDMLSYDEDPFFPDYDLIRLETNEKYLITEIDKMIFYENSIIIHSIKDQMVATFTNEGKFLGKLSIGNGPNEIIFPIDIAFDREKKLLGVLDMYRSIKEFDLNGICVNERKKEDPYMKLEYVKDAILLFDAHLGRKNPYLFEFEKNGKSKPAVRKTDKFRDIIYMPTTSFCYANDSVTYFYHQFEDRIYGWNYNSNETFTAIDLFYENGKSISGWDKGIKLNGDSKQSEYQTLYDNREYIFGIKNLYNLSNSLFFTVEDESVKYCMYDSEKNKLRMSSNLVAGLPDTRLRFFEGPDETLVFALTPEEIFEFIKENKVESNSKIKAIAETLSDDDNPVIVIAKNR